MTYLSINETTEEGRELLAMLKKSRAVTIHNTPNEETKQALEDAKDGKGVKKMGDIAEWFNKNFGA